MSIPRRVEILELPAAPRLLAADLQLRQQHCGGYERRQFPNAAARQLLKAALPAVGVPLYAALLAVHSGGELAVVVLEHSFGY